MSHESGGHGGGGGSSTVEERFRTASEKIVGETVQKVVFFPIVPFLMLLQIYKEDEGGHH